MAKKKTNNSGQALSPTRFVKERGRMVPIYKCYMDKDAVESGEANIMVIRKHKDGKYTVAVYLVDFFCCGVKDSFYRLWLDSSEFEEIQDRYIRGRNMMEIDYVEAHNRIYGAIAWAEEAGIEPINRSPSPSICSKKMMTASPSSSTSTARTDTTASLPLPVWKQANIWVRSRRTLGLTLRCTSRRKISMNSWRKKTTMTISTTTTKPSPRCNIPARVVNMVWNIRRCRLRNGRRMEHSWQDGVRRTKTSQHINYIGHDPYRNHQRHPRLLGRQVSDVLRGVR